MAKPTYDELVVENEALRKENAELKATVVSFRSELDALKKIVYGRKSEKIPSITRQLGKTIDPASTAEKRKDARENRKTAPVVDVHHQVPEEERICPKCGGTEFKTVGEGKISLVQEYIPAQYELHRHIRETLACSCGEYVVTAPVPPKPYPKSQYGAGFVSHVVTLKCSDAIPINRFANQVKREGGDISVSTLTDMFHKASDVLKPIPDRILECIAQDAVVQADETPLTVLNQKDRKKGYVWTFLSDNYIGYKFSISRSGETPAQVLGTSTGTLVVDAYSGYNGVTTPDGRERAGCMAHARRKFFAALSTCSVAQYALDRILEMYRVEHDALEKGIAKTDEHLKMRQTTSLKEMELLKVWLDKQKDAHLPQGPMSKAINYALNNWDSLKVYLTDAQIPIDNNASERALRKIALGRKNYLFAGSKQGGVNLAGLMTIVSTCEKHGINPEEYMKDVLLRIHTHPKDQLDDLLPHNWMTFRKDST